MSGKATNRDAETLTAFGLGDEDLAAWREAAWPTTRSTIG